MQTCNISIVLFFFFLFLLDGLGSLFYSPHSELINSEILNLIDNWYDSLDMWSARRKDATYTG
jgi:hypothetical protein